MPVFQKHTLHNQLCSALAVTSVTCVTPRILWVYIVNYKGRQLSCLCNVIFCTRTKTKLSSLPLQSDSRFRKLTVQAYSVPFIDRLTLQLFSEKNWSSWLMKRNKERFIFSARSKWLWNSVMKRRKEMIWKIRRKKHEKKTSILPVTTREAELIVSSEQHE